MTTAPDPIMQEQLEEEGLRYYSDSSPGFFRQKVGRGINYYDLNGKKITEERILARVNSLVIPPAWDKVWISPKKNGHLQTTGIDEKGRKQYIYHQDWVKVCQENKFSKMVDFGLSLPKIRQKIRHDLQSKLLDKRKILATVTWLLEHTFIRIGNEEYSKTNNSFGLTTLRNRHVKVNGSEITFQFRGKSGVNHVLQISDPMVAKTIKKCIELPGFELFQFIDENGNRHVVDSGDVNAFLKDVTKQDFSAKDFRTWGGSNLSANHFYNLGSWEDERTLKQHIVQTVKTVAGHLQNTVSVCRNYYIHPTVIDSYQKKTLLPHFDQHKKQKLTKPGLGWDEFALITLLQKKP